MEEDDKSMKINLHTHSNYSLDGEFDINYLIKYFIEKCKNLNVKNRVFSMV